MKQKLLYITIILFVIGCAKTNYYIKTTTSPDSNIKVAVINENTDPYWVTSIAYRTLITELMDVGFKVVERTNLQKIIVEQNMTSKGLIKESDAENHTEHIMSVLDKNNIKELGSMLGVDKLIVIYAVPSSNLKISICTIRLVDVFSAEVLTSTTIYAPLTGSIALGSSIDVLMKQAANDIMEAYKSGEKIIRNKLSIDQSNKSRETSPEAIFRNNFDNKNSDKNSDSFD